MKDAPACSRDSRSPELPLAHPGGWGRMYAGESDVPYPQNRLFTMDLANWAYPVIMGRHQMHLGD